MIVWFHRGGHDSEIIPLFCINRLLLNVKFYFILRKCYISLIKKPFCVLTITNNNVLSEDKFACFWTNFRSMFATVIETPRIHASTRVGCRKTLFPHFIFLELQPIKLLFWVLKKPFVWVALLDHCLGRESSVFVY